MKEAILMHKRSGGRTAHLKPDRMAYHTGIFIVHEIMPPSSRRSISFPTGHSHLSIKS